MKKQGLDNILIFGTLGAFLLIYLATFPMGWLISDEYSYINRAMAWANGDNTLSYADAVTSELIPYKSTRYPLGNSLWIAIWAKVCSSKLAYIGSLLSLLVSFYLTYRILIKDGMYTMAVLLFFLYPPLAFFSKSFMSCMPSLLLVSGFLYILYHFEEQGRKWLLLSFLAALSFWIRETNIVLLGSICLIHFIEDRKWFLYYVTGAILGLLPRIISSYYIYDDPFHYVLAESFSLRHFVTNARVYGVLLLCFMPLGLFFIKAYRGRYFLPLQMSSFLFILMYLFYSFNSTYYSGFGKGTILMGRFMVPLLPIFVITVGWYFSSESPKNWTKIVHSHVFKIILTLFTLCALFGMHYMIYKESKIHKKVSNHIVQHYKDKMIMYDLSRTTNIIRYINDFHGKMNYVSDISNVENNDYMKKLFGKFEEAYLIQTLNTENSDKSKHTSKISKIVNNATERFTSEEIKMIHIKPSLSLQIIRITPGDE